MAELSTGIAIHYLPEFHDCRIRFRGPRHRQNRNCGHAVVYFAGGRVFAYVCWETIEYGTRLWRLFLARAGDDPVTIQPFPDSPLGREILLVLRHPDVGERDLLFACPGPLSPAFILTHMPATAPVAALPMRQ